MKKIIILIFIFSTISYARDSIKFNQKSIKDTLFTYATDTMYAPKDKIWKAIVDFENIDKFMPSVKKCTIYKKEKNTIITHMQVSAIIKTIDYYVKNIIIKKGNIFRWQNFKKDGAKNPFYYNNGGWILKSAGKNKTIATYWISLKYKTKIPKWIERRLIKGSIPDVFDSIEKRTKTY